MIFGMPWHEVLVIVALFVLSVMYVSGVYES